ncbi:Glyco_18 domain-containing protein [Candidatus Hydrogenisulfobacillus filiaventi]|uniref:Glyco_18 domain-containing protein n=1 Tax=Candidatus Hydrogenisulfobacillus filiaventi TaxID=2707344 RepID=A0A6F8ZJN0_9FIRM|nr:glycosyl hydrolase family 18 protein [Bacillota bacterium]CAB1129998.1 Glyco_18 domain-containing protein [Candidatus Hydrogenisulfobacillus filiaventi]
MLRTWEPPVTRLRAGGRLRRLWPAGWAAAVLMALGGALAFRGPLARAVTTVDRLLLPPAPRAAAVRTPAPPADGLPPALVLGYYYNPGHTANGVALLSRYVPVLNGIIPFWYTIHRNGSISGRTDPRVLELAQHHDLWTFALVSNMGGPAVYAALLGNPGAEQRAIDNLLTLVEVNGYDGVNLDWEAISPADRQAFTAFVGRLAQTFHRHGYYVTLSVPAETASQPANPWTGAYSYRQLGREADLLMIMAYDQHYPGSAPGPIASPAWVRQVLNYAVRRVPPAKIILGIPGYGYNWSGSGGAQAVTYGQALSLKGQHDSGGGNHFTYVQDGVVHTVWFENSASFLSKIHLVTGYELRGIALWRLGIEDPRIWNFLQ